MLGWFGFYPDEVLNLDMLSKEDRDKYISIFKSDDKDSINFALVVLEEMGIKFKKVI